MNLLSRLRSLFRRSRLDREMDDELRFHVEEQTQRNVAAGMAPDEAARAARKRFGWADRIREEGRDARGWVWLESVAKDVRFSLRTLRRSPGFTVVAVLTLALGLSANVTIFSLISYFFFQPLPVRDADRLAVVVRRSEKIDFPHGLSWPDYRDLRGQVGEFSDMIALFFCPVHLGAEGRLPDRTWIEAVSGNYFSALGVEPALGRLFLPEEGERPEADPIVVLAHHYWRRQFGGDPSLIGRTITINGRPLTVVGVAAEGFTSAQWALAPAAFVPATMAGRLLPGADVSLENRYLELFKVVGHLKPGVSAEQATAAVEVAAKRLDAEYRPTEGPARTYVIPERLSRPDPSVSGFMPFAAAVFMAMVSLVLFIACANVANLMFSRAIARQREMGIRAAVGGSRGRLIRQLLTECIILALIAGLFGLALSQWSSVLLARFAPQGDIPVQPDQRWDWHATVFTAVASVLAGVLTGLAPALRATAVDVQTVLKSGGLGTGRTHHLFRSGLVVSQVAFCVVVLVCGGLFLRSLTRISIVDLGFRPNGIAMVSLDLGLQGYSDERGRQFLEELTGRVRALPGVESAGVASTVFFDNRFDLRSVTSENPLPAGATGREDGAIPAGFNRVDPDFLGTMDVTLLQGRMFTRQDDGSAPSVAIINETLARRLWPEAGRDVLGRRFHFEGEQASVEVVGVVRDGKYIMLGEDPRPYVFVPLAQHYVSPAALHVRTAGDPLALVPTLRQTVRELDSNLPLFNARTMEEHMRSSAFAFMPLRMGAALAGAQGLLGLALAVMGVYGVVAYSVTQRTREIGIRVALGAQRLDVLRLVVRGGLRLTLIGVVLGLLMALGLSRLLSGMLYGLDPTNLPVFASVTLTLVGVALLACHLPARRATRVDPMVALRAE
jgi:putative ABC transport system permease protein